MESTLSKPEFPLSGKYDPEWVMDGNMGPNPLWLTEWLCGTMKLKPGMRVLDLGCGKALTSVFLAREYGVRVWAVDLWVDQDANWRRVVEAGLEDMICPVRAEAHALPFAAGFFDAVVSIYAYQYFGTDELYLQYLCNFVANGGSIGVVVPALVRPFEGDVPAHLAEPQSNGEQFWEDECMVFHTVEYWRDLWSRSGKVDVKAAELMPDGWRHWRDYEIEVEKAGKNIFPSYAEALDKDAGRYIGFVGVLGERRETDAINLYDQSIMNKMGLD